jgi:proteasome lid subunit RPN8/RPN11
LGKKILVAQTVVDSILSYAHMFHPKESILLLKGKNDKEKILLDDVQVPPLATHGSSFSSFPFNKLPIDFSVIGVAHSHPSGISNPSVSDMNNFYGRVMLITAYPYLSEHNILIFDRKGHPQEFTII